MSGDYHVGDAKTRGGQNRGGGQGQQGQGGGQGRRRRNRRPQRSGEYQGGGAPNTPRAETTQKKGFFAKVVSWFTGSGATTPPVTTQPERPVRSESAPREGGRDGRDGRQGQNGRREDRPNRGERNGDRQGHRQERAERPQKTREDFLKDSTAEGSDRHDDEEHLDEEHAHDEPANGEAREPRAERPARTERPERAERTEREERPERSDRPPADEPEEITSPKLYVGNLAWETAESDLFDLFSKVGAVKSAEVVKDRQNQRSKGFGFVEMEALESAKKAAQELNRTDFMGRQIRVSGAKVSDRRAA